MSWISALDFRQCRVSPTRRCDRWFALAVAMTYGLGAMLRGWLVGGVGAVAGPYFGVRVCLAASLGVLLATRSCAEQPVPRHFTHAEILHAIRWVETSDRTNPPDGDDGRAIGPYQIHRLYWQDARLPGDYQECHRREYAERVITAYMQRWVPEAWRNCDAEAIARTHNGGPRGRSKGQTDRYWARVESWLRGLPQPE